MARAVLTVLAVLWAAAPAAAQLKVKREELSRIQGELKQTLKELSELREAEKELDDDVKGLENRDAQSRRRVDDLQAGIRRAESRRTDLKSRLDAARSIAGFWSAAIASEIERHAASEASRCETYGTRELWAEEFRRSAVIEKARHLRGLHGFRRKTEEAAQETGRKALELSEIRRRAQSERDGRRREYERKKAELEETQVKVAAAARRAKELEESAHALTSLLDKLGKAGKYRPSGAQAKLEIPKHSLPWPAEGRVLRPFGRERDPQLGTWTVRQGTLFVTAAGAAVGAVAPGRVIFTGPFRSYGRVVIADHGDGFFSVYGELGEIAKNKGDAVRAGEMLARAGAAKDGAVEAGRVYLEIRRGTEALDPAEWLERK
ncbi:MAG: peptidoglycan DD-metalloendopeptidase family protein [Elusimicrobia bacterium]|nr:peptidoglycan DD-metalloendopeptidase family protein [Elusimicrobiota bacterium]